MWRRSYSLVVQGLKQPLRVLNFGLLALMVTAEAGPFSHTINEPPMNRHCVPAGLVSICGIRSEVSRGFGSGAVDWRLLINIHRPLPSISTTTSWTLPGCIVRDNGLLCSMGPSASSGEVMVRARSSSACRRRASSSTGLQSVDLMHLLKSIVIP